MFKMSVEARNALLDGLAENFGVVCDERGTWAKFDRLDIAPAGDGRHEVRFIFAGKHVCSLFSGPLRPYDALTISGIEGRTQLRLMD